MPSKLSWTPTIPTVSAAPWMRLFTAYTQMSMAAAEVIMHRTIRMSQGTMELPEMYGMVMEKATAFAQASENMVVAAASGGDATHIAAAALKPYSRKTRSNVRKYRR